MSFSEKFKAFIGAHESPYDSSPTTFPQLKPEIIKLQLSLEGAGKERGFQNIPPSESQALDDVELRIIKYIDDEVKVAQESYYDNQKSHEDRINKLSAMGSNAKFKSIAIFAESDFQNQIHKRKDELHTARVGVTALENDLKNFKAENGLERSAQYPHSKFLHITIAGLLMAFETVLNGQFFAKGHELGMIGGVFTAFVPSLLNVLSAYCLGNFAARLFIHKHSIKRVTGVLLCLGIPVVILAGNLLLSHYRSAMAGMIEFPEKEAISSFVNAPFSLGDIESWYLLATGCFAFCIATIGFWKMDDPYLGYGNISKAHQNKFDEYARLKSLALEELEDVRNSSLEELEVALSSISSKYSEANVIYDSQRRWSVLFNQHLQHLEGVGKSLLGFYRAENMAHRSTKPPKHFLKEWKMDRPNMPEPAVDYQRILKDFEKEAAVSQEVYTESAGQIANSYNDTLNAYETLEQLQPVEFEKWLKNSDQQNGIQKTEAA